jgi:hypothetical protein
MEDKNDIINRYKTFALIDMEAVVIAIQKDDYDNARDFTKHLAEVLNDICILRKLK